MISAWPVIIFLALWVAVLKAQKSQLERRLQLNALLDEPALPPAPSPLALPPATQDTGVMDDPTRPGYYHHRRELQRQKTEHLQMRDRTSAPIERARHNKAIADLTAQLRSMQ
jgi:hypothetical protein